MKPTSPHESYADAAPPTAPPRLANLDRSRMESSIVRARGAIDKHLAGVAAGPLTVLVSLKRNAERTDGGFVVPPGWLADGQLTRLAAAALLDDGAARAAIAARIVVMQGKGAIGKLGCPRLKHLAESMAEGIRCGFRTEGEPGHWYVWRPITEADADDWFVVDLAAVPPTDAQIVTAYEAAQRDGVKPGRGVIWLGRIAEAVMVGIYAIDMEVVTAAWRRELKRRRAESDRARRYEVTCQGDHPLDLDVD